MYNKSNHNEISSYLIERSLLGKIPRTPMTCITTQKQKDDTGRKKGLGPLMSLLMLFGKPDAAAELFRMVRWANGLVCPNCGKQNIAKYCKYGHFQRYTCKDCKMTFNDKTGIILHYKQAPLILYCHTGESRGVGQPLCHDTNPTI